MRCQYCKKLTHSEDLHVYFNVKDWDKITELQSLENWKSAWEINQSDRDPHEIGQLKCGDIWIHFHAVKETKINVD